MAERNKNLHAPWRIPYIRSLADDRDDGCFLCRAVTETDRDAENLLLWRTGRAMVVMNRYPYTGGHLLIAPAEHVGSLELLAPDTLAELMALGRDMTTLLAHHMNAEGFNLGMNIGRPAGAGLPDHVHMHVVPRWAGDVNCLAVLDDIRVVHQALDELREELLAAGRELGLPRSADGPEAEVPW